MRIDLENAIATCLVDGGELIEATGALVLRGDPLRSPGVALTVSSEMRGKFSPASIRLELGTMLAR